MKRLFAVLIMLSLLCALYGCAEQTSVFVTPETTGESETVSLAETTDTEKQSESETEPVTTSEPEAATKNGSIALETETSAETKPVSTEAETSAPVTTQSPETEKVETSAHSVPEKETDSIKSIHASLISISFDHYDSKNEKTPFVLGSPLYGILYSGKRAQIGDTVTFSVKISPADHTDRVSVEVSNGLSYSLSGNTLRITVKHDGNYGTGRVSIYTLTEKGSISKNSDYSFVIDPAGDPFSDMASVLSDYIRLKGLQYTTFTEGYTASDPSKSVTHYSGAPAWDDMIDKLSSGWIKQCFDLIDRYKSMGFSKVNFIITDISVGFSAAI